MTTPHISSLGYRGRPERYVAATEAPPENRMNCLSVAFLIVALELGFGLLGWLIWRLM